MKQATTWNVRNQRARREDHDRCYPDRRQTPRTIEEVWSEAARAEYRKGKDFLFQGTVNIAELAKRRYSGKGA